MVPASSRPHVQQVAQLAGDPQAAAARDRRARGAQPGRGSTSLPSSCTSHSGSRGAGPRARWASPAAVLDGVRGHLSRPHQVRPPGPGRSPPPRRPGAVSRTSTSCHVSKPTAGPGPEQDRRGHAAVGQKHLRRARCSGLCRSGSSTSTRGWSPGTVRDLEVQGQLGMEAQHRCGDVGEGDVERGVELGPDPPSNPSRPRSCLDDHGDPADARGSAEIPRRPGGQRLPGVVRADGRASTTVAESPPPPGRAVRSLRHVGERPARSRGAPPACTARGGRGRRRRTVWRGRRRRPPSWCPDRVAQPDGPCRAGGPTFIAPVPRGSGGIRHRGCRSRRAPEALRDTGGEDVELRGERGPHRRAPQHAAARRQGQPVDLGNSSAACTRPTAPRCRGSAATTGRARGPQAHCPCAARRPASSRPSWR